MVIIHWAHEAQQNTNLESIISSSKYELNGKYNNVREVVGEKEKGKGKGKTGTKKYKKTLPITHIQVGS